MYPKKGVESDCLLPSVVVGEHSIPRRELKDSGGNLFGRHLTRIPRRELKVVVLSICSIKLIEYPKKGVERKPIVEIGELCWKYPKKGVESLVSTVEAI